MSFQKGFQIGSRAIEKLEAKIAQRREEKGGFLASFFGKNYNPYLLDCIAGSGWLPAYNFTLRVVPYLAKIGNFFAEEQSTRIKAFAPYDDFLYEQYTEQRFSHTIDYTNLCCFNIIPSPDDNVTARQMQNFWTSLRTLHEPVIFEIIANGKEGKIIFQMLCGPEDRNLLAGHLSSLLSNINPEGDDEDHLLNQFEDDFIEDFAYNYGGIGFNIGLINHYTYTLDTFASFDKPDPLSPLLLAIEPLLNPHSESRAHEGAVIQGMIYPARSLWEEHLKSIAEMTRLDERVNRYFGECPISRKLNYSIFALSLKMMLFIKKDIMTDKNEDRFTKYVEDIGLSFGIFDSADNALTCIPPYSEIYALPESYKNVEGDLTQEECLGVLQRNTYRHGFIINSQELAGLLHFPSKALQHPKLLSQKRGEIKAPEEFTEGFIGGSEIIRKEPQKEVKKEGIRIGINEIYGKEVPVYIPSEWRPHHVYVVGYTGMGKTTLLLNMIYQDILAGRGVGVIDVKGTGKLIRKLLLPLIPAHRIKDVILFDMTDTQYPIGFNLLDIESGMDKNQMKQQLLFVLQRATESNWTDPMETLFLMSVDALINDDKVHNIGEIETLIYDDAFRYQVVGKIQDPYNRNYWANVFPKVTEGTKGAIQRRLVDILSDANTRNVLTQGRMAFDFRDIISNQKILLARIPRGSYPITFRFFSRILIALLEMAAFSRKATTPFHLYVDEFQHFADETFEEIIDEARDAGLYLTLSHQRTDHLSDRMLSACMSTGTTIAFQVQPPDARRLEPFFGKLTAQDNLDLGKFRAFVRIGKASDAFSMRTYPEPESEEPDHTEEIVQYCREKYCSVGLPAPDERQEKEDDEFKIIE